MTDATKTPAQPETRLLLAQLPKARPTDFDLRPAEGALAALAQDLGLSGLRKLRFAGQITPTGKTDWRLQARLGATVVQPCVVSLAPVTTRIEEAVERLYLAGFHAPEAAEVEMPEDTTTEPLPDAIDLSELLAEALALAVPQYPRAEGAESGPQNFTEPGKAPMTDEDARPFAGLAKLRIVDPKPED